MLANLQEYKGHRGKTTPIMALIEETVTLLEILNLK